MLSSNRWRSAYDTLTLSYSRASLPPNGYPTMSRRDAILQLLFLLFLLVLGTGIFAAAINGWISGDWPPLGATKVAFLGLGMLLLGAVGVRGLFLSEGLQSQPYLARAYYHSRFGRYASIASSICLGHWLALRIYEAL